MFNEDDPMSDRIRVSVAMDNTGRQILMNRTNTRQTKETNNSNNYLFLPEFGHTGSKESG